MMRILLILSMLFVSNLANSKPVELVFWHSLAGQLGSEIHSLVDGFNANQDDYVVKLVYKGDYVESLTSFAAAFRAKKPPALIHVFEAGTATMLAPKGVIKPVDELMQEQALRLPQQSFFSVVRDNYSRNGRLMAMPFNLSVPVMFYNADVLARLGYDEASFPKTWDELEKLAFQLKQSGFACAYTSAYPSWILIESFSAMHGLPMIEASTKKSIYNNKSIISHLRRLRRWQQLGYFEYGGRSDDATILFTSGRCPLLSQSSGGFYSISSMVPFHVGMAALPYDPHLSARRFNNVAGGGAIWAVSGQTSKVYEGIARFFAYLAQPSVQQRWYQRTGYLPLGLDGVYQSLRSSLPQMPLNVSRQALIGQESVNLGFHMGPQNQIRMINDEALELIFSGMKQPAQAMDDAVIRSNYVLKRFQLNTQSS